MKHYLIDYENIQPNDFNRLNPNECHIWLFVGKLQTKLPLSFSQAQAKFGTAFHIIQVPKIGKNALDFVLASEIGRISKSYPKDELIIVSKDTGFDVLIEYHRELSITRMAETTSIQRDTSKPKSKLPIWQMLKNLFLPKVKQYYQKLPKNLIPKSAKSLINFILSILRSDLKHYDKVNQYHICQQLANHFI